MADDSFTRSLYIGRDKAIEVARRREAVEKELKARREAKIREQKDRISRATQQKEAELKEKSRQRQEKELQKQKKVLDRRCAQLEIEKAKKAEILQKAHISASRTSQSQKKPVYVFGSSTPRELSYLEKLTNDQKACNNNNRLAASNQTAHVSMERLLPRSNTPVRTFSRIVPVSLTQKKHPPSTAMTRSVFGTLSNNNIDQPPPSTKVLTKAPIKAGGAKDTPTARTTKSAGTPNLMTQSMYEQNKSSFTATKKPPAKPPTPVRSAKNLQKGSVTPATAALPPTPPVEPVKKPVIRPRKVVQEEPISDIKPDDGVQENQDMGSDGVMANETQAPLPLPDSPPESDVVERVANDVAAVEEEPQPQTPSSQQEMEQFVKKEVEQAIKGVISADFTSLPDAPTDIVQHEPHELLNEEKGDQPLIQLDSPAQQPVVADPQTDIFKVIEALTPVIQVKPDQSSNNIVEQQASPPPLQSPAKNGTGEQELSIETSKGSSNGETAEQFSPTTNPVSSPLSPPPVKGNAALEQAEQERESRRQRLNQILQRTRMDGNEGAPPKASAVANGIDASALAQDLLAQRRQKRQLQQLANSPVNGDSAARPTTLVDELAGFGFFQHNKSDMHMPGQIISPAAPTTQDHYLTSIKHTNNDEEKDSETDLSSGMSSPTSQGQPPEDPRTTNGHGNPSSTSSNTPPTEPSLVIR